MKTKDLIIGALIGGLYVALSLALAPVAYGPLQFRASEALTLLPLLFPQAVGGLFVGCLIANFFGGFGVIDIVFGSLATLCAAYLTSQIGKHIKRPNLAAVLGAIPPIVINALVIGGVMTYAMTNTVDAAPYYIFAGQIFITQTGVLYALGLPLLILVRKLLAKHAIS